MATTGQTVSDSFIDRLTSFVCARIGLIDFVFAENGVILPVKACPGARRTGMTGVHDGALKVAVSEAPEKGKATAAIIRVLADAIGIKKGQIQLISGQTSTQKKFLISGLDPQEIVARITRLIDEPDPSVES